MSFSTSINLVVYDKVTREVNTVTFAPIGSQTLQDAVLSINLLTEDFSFSYAYDDTFEINSNGTVIPTPPEPEAIPTSIGAPPPGGIQIAGNKPILSGTFGRSPHIEPGSSLLTYSASWLTQKDKIPLIEITAPIVGDTYITTNSGSLSIFSHNPLVVIV